MTKPSTPAIETYPLTPGRWRDFSELFNTSATTRHCWCMWPRIITDYRTQTDARNKRSVKKVVDTAKVPPGVLAYVDGVPAGWCAVAPRDDYSRPARSRTTAPLDEQPVWSVVCFFIRRGMRGKGLTKTLAVCCGRTRDPTRREDRRRIPGRGRRRPLPRCGICVHCRGVQGNRTPHPEPPAYALPHQASAQAGARLTYPATCSAATGKDQLGRAGCDAAAGVSLARCCACSAVSRVAVAISSSLRWARQRATASVRRQASAT